ncbi:MAG: CBS domain-containing protein [Methanobrevibacter sp.]|uniref:CBS domain-containing protein n=1 Tax=Methanobrevibacter sp. TaxID=66852 RepID=UPI0026DFC28A|nr:CBS domain-containing protein [Methanobrevibacter sp.]MDO5848819.1 CBS domain-containing protein [Methanobrevibacter sp.]
MLVLTSKVKDIMTKNVITVNPDMDVVYAFERLMKHKISAMPVVDEDKKIIGIVTATDLGHNLILDKYELGTQVGSIMVEDVFTISPEDTLESAINAMTKATSGNDILNQLPVVDGDELVGIISDGDIIKYIL